MIICLKACTSSAGEDGSAVTPDGAPVLQYVWGKFWVNNHAHVLTAKVTNDTRASLLLLRSLNVGPFVTGAVQAKLSQGNLRSIPVIVSSGMLTVEFGRIVDSLFATIRNLETHTRTLCELRDLVLPKLLNGEMFTEAFK